MHEFTVEYADSCGVVYYDAVTAANIADAKAQVRQWRPEAVIRAVTLVAEDNDAAQLK